MGVLSDMFTTKANSNNRKPSVKQSSFRLTDPGVARFEKYLTTGSEATTDALVMAAITESGSQSLNSLEQRYGISRNRLEHSLERLARNKWIAPIRAHSDY